ncbi:ATP-dependent helicase [Microbacterium sp. X-17]|uniref:ATP-dependent helicase n=1 Tax=Microbacterium sp. X-17 TaxID=3144404 RepID=UPI0031F4BC56
MNDDGALAGLDERQLEAATTLRGPLRVLAGAGTGKTRVITHRIAHGVDTGAYSPGRVMAVTFTAKAAGQLRGRLRALGIGGVAARTFHAAALAQLNFFWPQLAGDTAPAIVDNKVRMLAHAAEGLRLDLDTATLRDVASGIEWRKVTMRSVADYARERPNGVGRLGVATVVDLHEAYERLKDTRRQLDFEDVLLACAGMIESEPRVAHAVHEQYRHFTVDEFQDASPVQVRLLELWLGDRRDLCVVGDASQTIYSFAGAEARHLLEFESRHPDAVTVRLEANYRSEPPVLAVANALMRGRPGAVELIAATVAPAADVRPSVTAYPNDAEEARGIARQIARLVGTGVNPRDIAVLYRAHAQSAELLTALAEAGIAATVLGGRRFFDLPEVRKALLLLGGESKAHQQRDLHDAVRDVLRSAGFADDPPAAGGALRDAWEAQAAFLRLADEAPAGTTVPEFKRMMEARARDQHDPALRTVTLSTLHAAKGLEWDHVFLAGMAEGLLPIAYARTFEEVDEERRLAYVGITRAARTLALSWSEGFASQPRQPSRFLREIGTGTLDERRAPHAPAGATRAAALRTSRTPPPAARR